ncbi:hypothetical protein WME94_25225 [Sorangium sp. So ce429]
MDVKISSRRATELATDLVAELIKLRRALPNDTELELAERAARECAERLAARGAIVDPPHPNKPGTTGGT